MAYDYLAQSITATALIQPFDNDSFYNPVYNLHTGYAADGTHYTNGVQDAGPVYSSWYLEYGTSGDPYRGDQAAFPTYGLILLSPASMVILDEGTPVPQASQLKLWMQFLLADSNMFANNFNDSLQGFTPSGLNYADGIISIVYTPDSGNVDTFPPASPPSSGTHMVVSIDFTMDSAYLDVGIKE